MYPLQELSPLQVKGLSLSILSVMQSPSLNCFTETSNVASEISKSRKIEVREKAGVFSWDLEWDGKPLKQRNIDKPVPDGRRHRGEVAHRTSGQIPWRDREKQNLINLNGITCRGKKKKRLLCTGCSESVEYTTEKAKQLNNKAGFL